MENRLLDIQDLLFNQMKKLSEKNLNLQELNNEISRSNALTNSAITFIKAVNVNTRVREIAEKNNKTINEINKELGL